MAQGFNQLINALRRRYDFHSARAVLMEALETAGLEKKSSYEDKEWSKALKALQDVGDELDGVWQALGDAPKGVKLPKNDPPPAEKAKEAPVEAAEESPSPKKPAGKKPAAKAKGKSKG